MMTPNGKTAQPYTHDYFLIIWPVKTVIVFFNIQSKKTGLQELEIKK